MNTRWNRLAPLSGVVMVVLLLVSQILLGNEPGSGASGAQFISYFAKHRSAVQASAYLTGLVIVFAVYFYGYLREHLSQEEGAERLGLVAFGGAILFAAGGAVGAGTALALADVPTKLSPSAAQVLGLIQQDATVALIAGGAATLLICSALAIIQGRRLPIWIGWLALVLGIASLAPAKNLGAVFGGLWTLIVSIALYLRARRPSAANLTDSAGATSVAR